MIEKHIPSYLGDAVASVGKLRSKIRDLETPHGLATELASIDYRMKWMSRLCDAMEFEDLSKLSDQEIDRIAATYAEESNSRDDAGVGSSASGHSGPSGILKPATRTSDSNRPAPPVAVPPVSTILTMILAGIAMLFASATGTIHNVTDTIATYIYAIATTFITPITEIVSTYSSAIFEYSSSTQLTKTVRALHPKSYLSSFTIPSRSMQRSNDGKPKILLVGSGLGDPGLLTVKAVQSLKMADLVISDQLVPQSILSLIPATTELKVVPRKAKGKSDLAQSDANEWLLSAAKQNKFIVRLKGGDPFLFGRGGEETLFLEEHGYTVEYIPGISSCISAPGLVGIPVTHRGVADQMLVLTARGEGGVAPNIPQYEAKRTLIMLMAVANMKDMIHLMFDKGFPKHVPAAIVEKAGWENQRVVSGSLENIAEIAKNENVGSPSVFVVGHVVDVLRKGRDERLALGKSAADDSAITMQDMEE